MASPYAFRPGPSYYGANPQDQLDDALTQPMSIASTLGDQVAGGVLDSLGLGTLLRSAGVPALLNDRRFPFESADSYKRRKEEFDQKSISEEEYKSSPYYREGVRWDRGMTEDRAAALADAYDAKRVREHFASLRPITSFIGNFAGQAVDPINYIPIAGPSVRAAAATRFGVVGGRMAVGALDAGVNTAVASAVTYDIRRGFGDDITWQSTLSDIAMSALIGSAFGGVSGLMERRRLGKLATAQKEAAARLATLQNVQTARTALNEAIDGLVRGDDVSLSANSMERIQRIADRQNPVWSPDTFASMDRTDLFSSTAVGRVTDTRSFMVREFEDAIRQEIFRNQPALQERWNKANDKFQKAQDAVAVIEEPLAARRQSDSVAMLEPASAERLRAIEDELAGPVKATRRQALEAERSVIVETIGPDAIAKAENDFRIGPQKQAKAARKALAAARQEFSKVNDEVNAAGERIRAANKVRLQTAIDRSPAPVAQPLPERVEAEARIAKPTDYKAIAEQFRVNPDDGSFVEQAEVDQVRKEGRVTAEDEADLQRADETFENSVSYGEALKAAVACVI